MGRFGSSVALSADGDTALIGGLGDDGLKGAAWVFMRTGSTWSQQGGKLTGRGESRRRRIRRQRRALRGRQHGANRRVQRQRHRRRGLGIHTLGLDLGPAGRKAHRHRRNRGQPVRLQRGALRRRQYRADRGPSRQRRRGRRLGVHALGLGLEPAGWKDHRPRRDRRRRIRPERRALRRRQHGADRWARGRHSEGAAWVFTRSAGAWSQQGPKLTGGEEDSTEFGVLVVQSPPTATPRWSAAGRTTARRARRGCSRARAACGASRGRN